MNTNNNCIYTNNRFALFSLVVLLTIAGGNRQAKGQNLLLNPGAELGSLADWTVTGPAVPGVDSNGTGWHEINSLFDGFRSQ